MTALLPTLLDPPDRPALRAGDHSLSHPELAVLAAALATRIRAAVPEDGRIAVHAVPGIHTAVAVAAAVLAGVPAVPLNAKLGERELGHVLADAAPAAVLAAPGAALPAGLAALPLVEVDLGLTDGDAPPPDPGPAATALVVYTSGTTGPPKGAVLSRGAVAANLDALAAAWAWTHDDVLAHGLPLFHVHGLVLGVLGPLRRGGALHHLAALDAPTLAAAVTDGATMVFGVPTQYHRLADQLESDAAAAAAIGRARLLVSGSAALTAVDHERVARLTGLGVRERYGLTESLILTAARADETPEPGTVGRPLRGTDVWLVPVEGDPDLGAVHVRGPGLFDGYLNRPDATAAAHTDGWFATGDIGRWTESGALALVGREAIDLIKSGGYKIGAGEIENALLEHPGVAEAAVLGMPDADLGERVVAVVVLSGVGGAKGEPPGERELIDHVAALLSPHKRPREVRFTDALPRNDMGKVLKARLREG